MAPECFNVIVQIITNDKKYVRLVFRVSLRSRIKENGKSEGQTEKAEQEMHEFLRGEGCGQREDGPREIPLL